MSRCQRLRAVRCRSSQTSGWTPRYGAEHAVCDRYRHVGALGRSTAPALLGRDRDENHGDEENTVMRLKHQWWSGLVAVVLGGLVGVTAVAAGGQFLPMLVTREGAQRFSNIPRADGYIAYLTLLNERDGGINGVRLVWVERGTVQV